MIPRGRTTSVAIGPAFGLAVVGLASAAASPLPAQSQEAPPDVGELISSLDSSDARERAMAACWLGKRTASDVRPAMSRLIEMLSDDTPVEPQLCREWGNWRDGRQEPSSPGREAAVALEELGSEALDPLFGVLGDPNGVARENAALALGLIDDGRAVDPLAGVLANDGIAAVRARAAWSIGMIEDSRGVDALSSAIRGDDDHEVREQAAWGLGMIEDSRGVDPLVEGLSDSEAGVREQAAWGLGMIESGTGVAGLSRAARDSDADVREQVAWALGMIESVEGIAALEALLDDPSPDVREQAAWGLGMIESRDAVPALIDALGDSDPEVREQAAWALGMTEAGSAAQALAEALEDEDEGVRKQAMWALTRVMQSGDVELDTHELAERLRRALRQRRNP